MEALSYESTVPKGLILCSQIKGDRGVIYERGRTKTGQRILIHLPAYSDSIWTIDTGNPSTIVVPATETETLAMYTQTKLNAKDVVKLTNPVGTVIRGVWRPGLIEEINIHCARYVRRRRGRSRTCVIDYSGYAERCITIHRARRKRNKRIWAQNKESIDTRVH